MSTRVMLDRLYCFHTQISFDAGLSKADRPAFVRLSGVLTAPASRSWKFFIMGSSAAVLGKNGLFIAELHLMVNNNKQQIRHSFLATTFETQSFSDGAICVEIYLRTCR